MASLQSLSLREPLQRVPSCASLNPASITLAIVSEQEQKTCAICQDVLVVGSACVEIGCSGAHQYHPICIDERLEVGIDERLKAYNRACPQSRWVCPEERRMSAVMQSIQNNDFENLLQWIRGGGRSQADQEQLFLGIIQTAAARETRTFTNENRLSEPERHAGLVRKILEAYPNISGPSLTRSLGILTVHNGSSELLRVLLTRGSSWQKIIYNPFVKFLWNFILLVPYLFVVVLCLSLVLTFLGHLLIKSFIDDVQRPGNEVDLNGVFLDYLEYQWVKNPQLNHYTTYQSLQIPVEPLQKYA